MIRRPLLPTPSTYEKSIDRYSATAAPTDTWKPNDMGRNLPARPFVTAAANRAWVDNCVHP
jgi:hypothetical protein